MNAAFLLVISMPGTWIAGEFGRVPRDPGPVACQRADSVLGATRVLPGRGIFAGQAVVGLDTGRPRAAGS